MSHGSPCLRVYRLHTGVEELQETRAEHVGHPMAPHALLRSSWGAKRPPYRGREVARGERWG